MTLLSLYSDDETERKKLEFKIQMQE